jgi:hypothetical protein
VQHRTEAATLHNSCSQLACRRATARSPAITAVACSLQARHKHALGDIEWRQGWQANQLQHSTHSSNLRESPAILHLTTAAAPDRSCSTALKLQFLACQAYSRSKSPRHSSEHQSSRRQTATISIPSAICCSPQHQQKLRPVCLPGVLSLQVPKSLLWCACCKHATTSTGGTCAAAGLAGQPAAALHTIAGRFPGTIVAIARTRSCDQVACRRASARRLVVTAVSTLAASTHTTASKHCGTWCSGRASRPTRCSNKQQHYRKQLCSDANCAKVRSSLLAC